METKGTISCHVKNLIEYNERRKERYPDNGSHAENNGENNEKDLLRSRQRKLQSASVDKAWILAR